MTSPYFTNGSLRCLLLIIPYILTNCIDSFAQESISQLIPEPVPAVNLIEESVPGRVLLSWDPPTTDTDGNPISPYELTYMVYTPTEEGILYPITETPVISRTLIRQVCEPDDKSTVQFYVMSLLNGIPAESMTASRKIAVGVSEPLPYYNGFTPADLSREILYAESDDDSGFLSIVEQQGNTLAAGDDDLYFALAEQNALNTTLEIYTGKINLSQVENPELIIKYYKWSSQDFNTIDISGLCEDGEIIKIATIDNADAGIGWNSYKCKLNKLKQHKPQIILSFNFISYLTTPFDSLAIYDIVDSVEMIDKDDISIQTISGETFISGLSRNDKWIVYDITGSVLSSGEGEATLSLAPGIYLITFFGAADNSLIKTLKFSVGK